jgi:hypothetical protein
MLPGCNWVYWRLPAVIALMEIPRVIHALNESPAGHSSRCRCIATVRTVYCRVGRLGWRAGFTAARGRSQQTTRCRVGRPGVRCRVKQQHAGVAANASGAEARRRQVQMVPSPIARECFVLDLTRAGSFTATTKRCSRTRRQIMTRFVKGNVTPPPVDEDHISVVVIGKGESQNGRIMA